MPPKIASSDASADPTHWADALGASKVVVVAGKGGVGKTTVTALLARAAADAGRHVLVVDLDGKDALTELVPDVDVRHISGADSLDEYLREHGFRRIAERLNASGVIDVVGTAAPGIDDTVVLGKIKQLERSGRWDLVVVDGPAAGHALTFLTSPAGLADAVSGGPVRDQADAVLEMLRDPARSQVVLVTLPERTPVNETIETAFALEDRVGVQLGPVVVNAVDLATPVPDADATESALRRSGLDASEADVLRRAASFRRERRASEAEALERLRVGLPLPQVHVPWLPVAGLLSVDLAELASSTRFVDPTEAP